MLIKYTNILYFIVKVTKLLIIILINIQIFIKIKIIDI